MSELSILDPDAALRSLADDRELYMELVSIYLEDSPEVFSAIVSQWDNAELRRPPAHKLKSMSRSVGAARLGEFCQAAERDEADLDSKEQFESLFASTQERLVQL